MHALRFQRALISVLAGIATFAALWLSFEHPAAQAAPLLVYPGCAGTLQTCINNAQSGDTIMIQAGRYTETIYLGKAVSLMGVNSATVIFNAPPNKGVLTVYNVWPPSLPPITPSTIISGMSFIGGMLTTTTPSCPGYCGGGVIVYSGAQPSLINVVISGNVAYRGGGLYADTGVPLTLINSIVMNNLSTGDGGGIAATSATPLNLVNTRVRNNQSISGSGGGVFAAAPLTLLNGDVLDNAVLQSIGGGIFAGDALTLTGVALQNNSSAIGGGAYATGRALVTGSRFEQNTSLPFNGEVLPLFGGSLYAGSALALSSTDFVANTSWGKGGALFAAGATTIDGGRFERNVTQDAGGGAFLSSTATLTNVRFLSNTAGGAFPYGGGGLYVAGALTLTNGTFENNNNITQEGGGLHANSSATINGTQFISNATHYDGGGAFVAGTAIISAATFERNRSLADVGGGLYTFGTATVSNTRFISNTAARLGGGIFSSSALTFWGGQVANNRASLDGGGLYANSGVALTGTQFISNSALRSGGALYYRGISGSARFVNALFARNHAASGGAALTLASANSAVLLHSTIADTALNLSPAIYITGTSLYMTDTIVVNHQIAINQAAGSTVEDYNLYFGTTFSAVIAGGSFTPGVHVVRADPRFANPAADDYHLTLASPAIDVGVNAGVSFDVDGTPRPIGPGFDIGCDEFATLVRRLFLPLIRR